MVGLIIFLFLYSVIITIEFFKIKSAYHKANDKIIKYSKYKMICQKSGLEGYQTIEEYTKDD
ncbi:MAG: hypothetical protein ACOC56_00290 [Atribacterota bacterium]